MWKICCVTKTVAILCAFFASDARAELVDLAAIGDDESDFVLFDNSFPAGANVRLHFTAIAESRLSPIDDSTGLRFGFIAESTNGFWIPLGTPTDFIQLPPPTAPGVYVGVPLEMTLDLANPASRIGVFIEGGGPADNSSVLGTFTQQAIPEPGTIALAGAAAMMLAWVTVRCRRRAI